MKRIALPVEPGERAARVANAIAGIPIAPKRLAEMLGVTGEQLTRWRIGREEVSDEVLRWLMTFAYVISDVPRQRRRTRATDVPIKKPLAVRARQIEEKARLGRERDESLARLGLSAPPPGMSWICCCEGTVLDRTRPAETMICCEKYILTHNTPSPIQETINHG